MLNEARIIAALKSDFPDYIGDDAAVIQQMNGQCYVVTNDILVENVHFRTSYTDPLSLAYKALNVNLSDIAAMGANPLFVLLAISIPLSLEQYAKKFLEHFSKACKNASIILIGGDTTRSPDTLFISVTAIGAAEPAHLKYRNKAKSGDVIAMIGNLGDAHLGLIALEKSLPGFEKYKHALLCPTAKINEGIWLGKQTHVSAMMDISDGLFIDLKRLCLSSNIQGNIELNYFQPTEKFISACSKLGLDSVEIMLTGGEDYGLLFTVNKIHYEKLAENFVKQFGYEIKPIGSIMAGSGLRLTKNNIDTELKFKSFSHFGENG